jgi:hypothetical protein
VTKKIRVDEHDVAQDGETGDNRQARRVAPSSCSFLYGHQHDQDGEQEIGPGRKDRVLLAHNPSRFLPQPIASSRDSPPGRHREMGRVPQTYMSFQIGLKCSGG